MSSKPRILVVDDEPTHVVMLRQALTQAGYEAQVAHDGYAAVELAAEARPDLILLDMSTPPPAPVGKHHGLETCVMLKSREDTASIPVIFVIAHSDTASIVKAFAAGGCDYVTQPFTIEEFLARVSVQLRLRSAERALMQKNTQLDILSRKLAEMNEELARQCRLDPLTKPVQAQPPGGAGILLAKGSYEEEVGKMPAPHAPRRVNPPACDRVSVLVVDDEPSNRRLCAACLAREGYETREAANGLAALLEVERDPPDVILMDVMMPEMDGLCCVRRIKANPYSRDIPVIMVSALTETANVVAGFEAGAEEYLTKPIRTTELVARVRSMVRLQRERKDLLRSYHLRAEQIHILMVLLDFCRQISQAATCEEMLDGSLAAVADIAGSRRVSIMLPDADRRYLTIARSIGIEASVAAAVRVPIGEGIAGRVFESRQPIVVNQAGEEPYQPEHHDSPLFASVPLLSAPLCTTGETLGVLNVTDRIDGGAFEGRELEYIEVLAGITGSALHSHASRQSRDEARDLIMVALAKLAEHRDSDTAKHVERVTQYAIVLAQELRTRQGFRDEIDDEFISNMSRAVPLHDIGKVAIPDAILQKPGRLTMDEMAIMRTHTQVGAETLRPVLERAPQVKFLTMAVQIIHSHHEWYDGSGYPVGLAGTAIPLSARIVAVADVYDALTTKRVYKEAVSPEEAVGTILKLSGTQFEPAVVDAFRRHQDEFKRLAAELGDAVEPSRTLDVTFPSRPAARPAIPALAGVSAYRGG